LLFLKDIADRTLNVDLFRIAADVAAVNHTIAGSLRPKEAMLRITKLGIDFV